METHLTPTTYSLATRDGAIVLTVRGDIDPFEPSELRANLMVAEVIPRHDLVVDLSGAESLSARVLDVLESAGARLAVERRRLVVVLRPQVAATARRQLFTRPVATSVADAYRILGKPRGTTGAAA